MDKINLEFTLNTDLPELEIKELLFLGAEGKCEIEIEDLTPKLDESKELKEPQKVGEILVESGDVSQEDLDRTLAKQNKIGEKLVKEGLTSKEKVASALAKQNNQKQKAAQRARNIAATNIRVNSAKLDKLFNLIGELVTVQERLSQASGVINKTESENLGKILQEFDMEGISEEISMLTNSLRDNALSIRMLPVESTFNKFKRLVHDLSKDLDKEIALTMSGTETEIDKTVIDKLDEPLMHMIRNCADHGIETPEERELAGKPRQGTIHLSAEHISGNVVIHVRDDGAGLNKDAILKRAIDRGLVDSEANLSEKEIFGLIFAPGFSTAKEVTNVSGRGVGMDVVLKTIENLRGNVEVFSTYGQGTQIDITLPLTLAIIDGLLVTIGGQAFVLPLSVVEECIELKHEESQNKSMGGDLTNVRGSLVPYIRLRDTFKMEGDAPPIEQIVISYVKGQRIGFVVDTVVGEHKTVIKSLGKTYKNVPEFSGATIMGDGSIAIIIDASRLID